MADEIRVRLRPAAAFRFCPGTEGALFATDLAFTDPPVGFCNSFNNSGCLSTSTSESEQLRRNFAVFGSCLGGFRLALSDHGREDENTLLAFLHETA